MILATIMQGGLVYICYDRQAYSLQSYSLTNYIDFSGLKLIILVLFFRCTQFLIMKSNRFRSMKKHLLRFCKIIPFCEFFLFGVLVKLKKPKFIQLLAQQFISFQNKYQYSFTALQKILKTDVLLSIKHSVFYEIIYLNALINELICEMRFKEF